MVSGNAWQSCKIHSLMARQPFGRRVEGTRALAEEVTQSRSGEASETDSGLVLLYEPNPKHKEPWQRGARGSLCPAEADGPALLLESELDPDHSGKRYATDGARAYCGHEHAPGRWHGFPVEWRRVPQKLWRDWLANGRISRRGLREHW